MAASTYAVATQATRSIPRDVRGVTFDAQRRRSMQRRESPSPLPFLLAQVVIRHDMNYHAAILRAAVGAVVARHRPLEAEAHNAHARTGHAQTHQIIGHRLGAA